MTTIGISVSRKVISSKNHLVPRKLAYLLGRDYFSFEMLPFLGEKFAHCGHSIILKQGDVPSLPFGVRWGRNNLKQKIKLLGFLNMKRYTNVFTWSWVCFFQISDDKFTSQGCWMLGTQKIDLKKKCDQQKLTNWINQTKHYIPWTPITYIFRGFYSK